MLFFNSDNKSKDLNNPKSSGAMHKMTFLGIALLLVFASFVSFASATQEAVIRTVPAQSIWIADGVTEYRMDVYVDTTQLPSELTSGVKWRILRPQGLQSNIVMTGAQLASQNYFFEGYSSYTVNTFGATWQNQQIGSWGNVPPRQGYLGSYWFKVMPGTGKLSTSFNLNNIVFSNGDTPDPNPLPYHVENVPFSVREAHGPAVTRVSICDNGDC